MLHTVGIVEVPLALAALLPADLGILPQLSTVVAGSLAAAALLGGAMPASAAGTSLTAVNLALAAVGLFVVGGRASLEPVAPFADETESSAAFPRVSLSE